LKLFYNIFIQLYYFGIRIASLFATKPKLWLDGRADWQNRLKKALIAKPHAPTLWMHCASLGEFEQGRPVLEAFKASQPQAKIVLSFFSPSGYEIRKDYALADHVCYLPLDTPTNAKQFIEIVAPDLVIFVKYEFWYHYLQATADCSIPLYLIAGAFRKNQPFFKWYGSLHRKMLYCFSHFFVQNEASLQLLQGLNITQVTKAGDTRIDRVLDIAQNPKSLPIIQSFKGNHKLLVIGSSWERDEQILFDYFNQHLPADWKVVIAPHNIEPSNINRLAQLIALPHALYSEAQNRDLSQFEVLIINNIGLLSSIYQYGDLGYIGGGFGTGIHNTLEPIAFKLPLIFGPKYHKFQEAIQLLEDKAAISITDTSAFQEAFEEYMKDEYRAQAGQKAFTYLQTNKGASAQIMQRINAELR